MKKINLLIAVSAALLLQLFTVEGRSSAGPEELTIREDFAPIQRKEFQLHTPSRKTKLTLLQSDQEIETLSLIQVCDVYATYFHKSKKLKKTRLKALSERALLHVSFAEEIVEDERKLPKALKKNLQKKDKRFIKDSIKCIPVNERDHKCITIETDVRAKFLRVTGGFEDLSLNSLYCLQRLLAETNKQLRNDGTKNYFLVKLSHTIVHVNGLIEKRISCGKSHVRKTEKLFKLWLKVVGRLNDLTKKLQLNPYFHTVDLYEDFTQFQAAAQKFEDEKNSLDHEKTRMHAMHLNTNVCNVLELDTAFEQSLTGQFKKLNILRVWYEDLEKKILAFLEPVDNSPPTPTLEVEDHQSTTGFAYQKEQEEAEKKRAEKKRLANKKKREKKKARKKANAYKAWIQKLIEEEKLKHAHDDSGSEGELEEISALPKKVAKWLQSKEEVQSYLHLTGIFHGVSSVHGLNKALDSAGISRNGLNIETVDFEGNDVISIRFNDQFRFILYKDTSMSEYFQTIFTKHYKR